MRKRPAISETELAVLDLLWNKGPATVRELLEVAGESGHIWAYTTLQTLLNRLERKGYVVRAAHRV